MRTWFQHLWTDEDAFRSLMRVIGKYAVTVAGFYLPLLVDSKYAWVAGPLIASAGASIPTKPLVPKTP